ncbi:BAG family molecular chaperone regulator 4-like isoform X2 [Olea europaea var. sylvestris]|uniref:BAG family molecular chaperone regulator 4-like n=1 Tax=Olea europaea subsp. europaea TaxID=158383 RepID=A0A8S0QHH0_OLEEU|nr:BAG family molecular chaperone regulator 4-like isoform X2 [Olea europaea var. sylvestris]CAA2966771.1 BAG family molecular chaperone regulator 4-like [Olea europaea subsp. europaea]
MKGSNSSPENGKNSNNDVHKREEDDTSDHGPSSITIKVSHGQNLYDVVVPANSTFGDLKLMVTQSIGLDPETHKLVFRGKEKEDNEHLQLAGVKDMSKMLLMEDTTCKEERPVEVAQTSVVSRGGAAVAEIRKDIDELSEQVSALQAVVDGGTKIDDKDIVYVTEMLMRQLLKLDGIEAEGEGKVQRKMEVRRIQSFVETMDILKSKNSNPFSNTGNSASVSTEWETFESGSSSVNALPTGPSSTKLTHDWEQFD